MDTFEDWLDNMFAPYRLNRRLAEARDELRERMRQRHAILKAAGKSDAEATAMVIDECGSLEDLADDLGITEELRLARPEGPIFEYVQARPLIDAVLATRLTYAFAIALIIISPLPTLWLTFAEKDTLGVSSGRAVFFGLVLTAVIIGAGIWLLRRRAARLARARRPIDGKIASVACENACRKEAWHASKRWHNTATFGIATLIVAGVPLFGIILVNGRLGLSLTLPVIAAVIGYMLTQRDLARAPLAPLGPGLEPQDD